MATATKAAPKVPKKKLIVSALDSPEYKKAKAALLRKYENAAKALDLVSIPNKGEIIKQLQNAYNAENKKLKAETDL